MPLELFPAPSSLVETGPGPSPDARVSRHRDASLPAEGFGIQIDAEGIRIEHADDSGLRYAEATLAQVRSQAGERLPGLRLQDAPDFPVRGVMLDVSRDRVPTRETLARLVDVLSLCRLNQLQLYTEHTFAYREHEAVWHEASPITPDDVRWLDAHCANHGIELVANQNCFGHMGRWLEHDRYRGMAEAPDGWQAPGLGRRKPGVLQPTEDNARFAVALVRELCESFSSKRVNIGCDETFELGLGRSRGEVEVRGRGRVYLDHLKRLLAPLHADGCEVLFWGDMLRSHPELAGELRHEDTIALAWHYEAPMDLGAVPEPLLARMRALGMTPETLRGFSGQVGAFRDAKLPYWVCPGTSSWNSLVGRWSNARRNLLDAAEIGLAQGASGYLITDWGDNGHLQPLSVSYPALVFGGGLAWGALRNRDLDVANVLDRLVFRDANAVLGSLLLEVGDAYLDTGRTAVNASPLFMDLVSGASLGYGEVDAVATRAVADRLGEALVRVGHGEPAASDGATCVRELAQAIRLARHGAWRMLRAAGGVAPDVSALYDDLAGGIEEQQACWRLRSREGGLRDSIARLERTLAATH